MGEPVIFSALPTDITDVHSSRYIQHLFMFCAINSTYTAILAPSCFRGPLSTISNAAKVRGYFFGCALEDDTNEVSASGMINAGVGTNPEAPHA